jgi:inosose dehydratase
MTLDSIGRRQFLRGLGSLSAASLILRSGTNVFSSTDSGIQFGYAAITWGGNDLQAIDDIAAVGFRGIQLRSNLLKEYGDKPAAVRDLLKKRGLQFVALSGGGPRGTSYVEADEVATQVKQATFLRDAGGLYLQMTDSARPKEGKPGPDDFKRLGRLLSEIGKRTSDLGISLGYHNHMGTLSQGPDETDAVLDAADPRYVKLLLDVAHYAQGGGDPVAAIHKYRDRILFLHIKDVETLQPPAYRFVELGRGRVDLPGVFAALKQIKFRGWAVVELDSVPDKSRTPKECATISKTYLETKLGMKI